MKKQRYIVEIEMPDGDFISAGWLKDIIQTDCDVEDESRKKVTVQETSIPSNLDEAAGEYSERFQDEKDKLYAFHGFRDGAMWRDSQAQRLSNDVDGAAEDMLDDAAYDWVMGNFGNPKESLFDFDCRCFKAGAEWMAGQGYTQEGIARPDDDEIWVNLKNTDIKDGDKVVVQIRKK